VRRRHENVGIAIQAYLYRSAGDVARLMEQGASVRLVKGAYDEPSDLAFAAKADTDANFVRLAEMLFGRQARGKGVYPALATHDLRLITWAKEHARSQGVAQDRFEFQMLYGIRPALQRQLAAEGYRVRAYVPYGAQWYPYLMRRLAERPANLFFLMRNLLRG
jgi:proline dehydrogenase